MATQDPTIPTWTQPGTAVAARRVTLEEEYAQPGYREPVPRIAAVCSAIRHGCVTALAVIGVLVVATLLILLFLALVGLKV
jgi:hypothetical protein